MSVADGLGLVCGAMLAYPSRGSRAGSDPRKREKPIPGYGVGPRGQIGWRWRFAHAEPLTGGRSDASDRQIVARHVSLD